MKRKSSGARGPDTARRIWLAGLGAYGRAFSEAQESLARVGGETSKVFDELVAKGEAIEHTVETKGREIAERVSPSFNLDDRIKRMRARLGMGIESAGAELDHLRDQLDRIETKLDALLARGEGKAAPSKKRQSAATKKKRATPRVR